MQNPAAARLPDGRLHLHHGPIDLIIAVEGRGRARALRRAERRFATILEELAAELPALRRPVGARLHGATAQRMQAAVAPFAPDFITPMAAVAGAVADEVLAAMRGDGIDDTSRISVNNGGDVAFHLAPGARIAAALAADPPARIEIAATDPSRGVATSGWRGRSHSLGIADAVTALAVNAAAADAAATMIANAVDLPGHPGVTRAPAEALAPDSDLGARLVTTGVAALDQTAIAAALARGEARARDLLARGLIHGAALILQGEMRLAGRDFFHQNPKPELTHA